MLNNDYSEDFVKKCNSHQPIFHSFIHSLSHQPVKVKRVMPKV